MIKYTDIYVSTLARGICNPGEQVVAAAAGTHQSFWTFRIPFFRHDYLLLATSERLIVVDHRKGLLFDRMDAVESFRWVDIGSLSLGGFFGAHLVVKDSANRTVLRMRTPRIEPIAKNGAALKKVVHAWEQRRALGSGMQAYGALPSSLVA